MGMGPPTGVWAASRARIPGENGTSSPSRRIQLLLREEWGFWALPPSDLFSTLTSQIPCYLRMSTTSGFYIFFCPSFLRWLLDLRDVIQMSHLEPSTPVSLFSVYNQLWVSVLITIYCKKKQLWWGLKEVCLIWLMSSQQNDLSSLPEPMTYPVNS